MGSTRDSISMSQALKMREEGFNEGLEKGRQEIIDWLQNAYLKDPAPPRGSVEANAILKLARAAADHFRPRVKGVKKPQDRKAKK